MIDLVIYTPEAETDLAVAYDWYEKREPGLGEDFLRCVKACVLTAHKYEVAIFGFHPETSQIALPTCSPRLPDRQ